MPWRRGCWSRSPIGGFQQSSQQWLSGLSPSDWTHQIRINAGRTDYSTGPVALWREERPWGWVTWGFDTTYSYSPPRPEQARIGQLYVAQVIVGDPAANSVQRRQIRSHVAPSRYRFDSPHRADELSTPVPSPGPSAAASPAYSRGTGYSGAAEVVRYFIVMSKIPSFTAQPNLRGERVLLRPVDVTDASGLVELLHDPEVRRLTGTPGPVRPGALQRAQEWYASKSSQTDELYLAIVELSSGEYAGELVLSELDVANESCSLRIALAGQRVFGRGLGTEAMRLVLGYAFGLAAVNRVGLEVYDFNPRARHVYEKVGFVHEGVQRQALRWDGQWIDCHMMSILACEWSAHQGHPELGD